MKKEKLRIIREAIFTSEVERFEFIFDIYMATICESNEAIAYEKFIRDQKLYEDSRGIVL